MLLTYFFPRFLTVFLALKKMLINKFNKIYNLLIEMDVEMSAVNVCIDYGQLSRDMSAVNVCIDYGQLLRDITRYVNNYPMKFVYARTLAN